MRKIVLMVLVAALGALAADEGSLQDTGSVGRSTADRVIDLHTANTGDSKDTIATTKIQRYGPYSLTAYDGGPKAAGFHLFFDATTGSDDEEAAFGYEVISGEDITDTLGNWTLVDTLDETASSSYTSLASVAGKAIVFEIDNYSDDETQIPGRVRIVFDDDPTAELRVR